MIWDAGGVSHPQQCNCNSTGTENCNNPTNIFEVQYMQVVVNPQLQLETEVYLHIHFLSTKNACYCIVFGGHCQLWHNNYLVAHME